VSSALLSTRGLQVAVPGRVLVSNLDVEIRAGEFLALLGGNGTGKSLLLRTLAGLRVATRGQVLLQDRDIGGLPRRDVARLLGFLPQDPEAVPQGAVSETVLLGRFAHLGFWEREGNSDESRVLEALTDVGIGPLADRELSSLSGGEQRRAAIARLLVQAPRVYLLDEPTNHLDPAQQIGVLRHLRRLADAGAAVVASLHDPNLALRFAHHVALLAGDGQVRILPTPALVPGDLAALYGLSYAETRLGARRLMAPD
jgi:iron complex transport system ATP-binding protein